MAEYKLELRGVCKSFPGVKALDNVQLSLRPGTVHALMGENGAGKSTLMKCLFGILSTRKRLLISIISASFQKEKSLPKTFLFKLTFYQSHLK